jgi:hypothetical protein
MGGFYLSDKSLQAETQDCKSPNTMGMQAILFDLG